MSRAPLQSLAAVALCAIACQAAAGAPAQTCPDRVHVASGALAPADIPAGWQANFADSQIWLTGNSVFDGPPEKGAALMPTSTRGSTATWKFAVPAADGYWLSCDYADGLIHLAVRADAKATSCRATFSKSGLPKVPHSEFTCQ